MMKENDNNKAELIGKITSPLKFAYEYKKRKYFRTEISIERLSGTIDRIPIITNCGTDYHGETVCVVGEFQSKNIVYDEKTHLMLYVFAHDIAPLEYDFNCNDLFLDGFICKTPNYRITSTSEIEICDILIAVNRSYSRMVDYIPTIVWNKNASVASQLDIGTHVRLYGRIQSLEYKKIIGDKTFLKTDYEFSVGRMEVSYE